MADASGVGVPVGVSIGVFVRVAVGELDGVFVAVFVCVAVVVEVAVLVAVPVILTASDGRKVTSPSPGSVMSDSSIAHVIIVCPSALLFHAPASLSHPCLSSDMDAISVAYCDASS